MFPLDFMQVAFAAGTNHGNEAGQRALDMRHKFPRKRLDRFPTVSLDVLSPNECRAGFACSQQSEPLRNSSALTIADSVRLCQT